MFFHYLKILERLTILKSFVIHLQKNVEDMHSLLLKMQMMQIKQLLKIMGQQ